MCYKKSEVHYEPLGVVAAIVSWNYRMVFGFPIILCSCISFSSAQCLVSYSGCPVCWQRDCHQVFGERRLVVCLVRRRS